MRIRLVARLAAVTAVAIVAIGFAALESPRAESMKDIRYVVVHSPGPAWKQGAPMFEQPGVQDHIDHYRKMYAEGKLVLGGPFLDGGAGGMMIPEAGLSEAEIRAFAEADPAVKSGLLKAEVRPWMIGMKK